jgi:GntR family transcriptional regulator/MocR family aminotransferase
MMRIPIQLDRTRRVSFQNQIETQLKALVRRGLLRAGDRLPASRLLANDLGVARRTVSAVYEQLVAEGFLESRSRGGTFVALLSEEGSGRGTELADEPREASRTSWNSNLLAQSAPILYVPPDRRFAYDFRLGKPDASAFPVQSWRRLLAQHVETAGRASSDYTEPAGHPALREALCRDLLPARGIVCRPDDIVIVGGTQEGINLLARLFQVAGSVVAIENPCYEGAALALHNLGAKLLPLDVDGDGLRTDLLAATAARLVYATPSHQFPLGVTMSAERRRMLLEWADATGSTIFEDDYDSDVQYDPALPALKAIAPDHVAYVGSFSKLLGPGLRLGYVMPPRRLARAARAMKSIMSNGQPWLEQSVLAEFIGTGQFDRHRRMMRTHYRQRRDVLLDALTKMAPGSSFDGLGSGMHLAWRLAAQLPDVERLREACARAGVGIYSLSASPCFTFRPVKDQGRLAFCGYAALGPDKIELAVSRMARVVETLAESQRAC